MGRAGSRATVEGPSKRPARSPWTRRARAWADLAPVGAQLADAGAPPSLGGLEEGVDHGRQDGAWRPRRGRAARAASRAVRSTGLQGAAEGGFGQGGQQAHAPLGDLGLPGGVVDAGGAGAFVEGVEPGRPADAQLDDLAAQGPGHRRPFSFGVAGHVDPPAEGDAAGGQGLGQGGFAPADLAGQEDVGVGQHAPLVEDPGVVAEGRARPGVLADQDARRAEPFLGQERVGARPAPRWWPGARGGAARHQGRPACGPGSPRPAGTGDRRCSAAGRLRPGPGGRPSAGGGASTSSWRAARSWARSALGCRRAARSRPGRSTRPPSPGIRGRRRRVAPVRSATSAARHRRSLSGRGRPTGSARSCRCRRRIRKRRGPAAGPPG